MFKNSKIFFIINIFLLCLKSYSQSQASCVPSRETINYPHHGQYHRMHPSGNYFLYTNYDKVVLVDITDRNNPKKIETKLDNETYPVEAADGGWFLLASPRFSGARGPNGGMDFYRFSDVVGERPMDAVPAYTDPNFGEYYHSTAELPTSKGQTKHVRMLLFSDEKYRDYKMNMSETGENIKDVEIVKDGNLCNNIFGQKRKSPEELQKFREARLEINKLEDNLWRLQRSRERSADDDQKIRDLKNEIKSKTEKIEAEFYGVEYVNEQQKSRAMQEQINKAEKELDKIILPESNRISALREAYYKRYSEVEQTYREQMQKLRENSSQNMEERFKLSREIENRYREERTKIENTTEMRENSRDREKINAKISNIRRTSPLGKKLRALESEHDEIRQNLRILRDGKQISNPVLSKDGSFVAGLVGNKIEVYQIDSKGSCSLVERLPYQGSKVNFSYPEKGRLPKITFTAESAGDGFTRNAIIYDLNTKESNVISTPEDKNPYYPGFTRDGRVMFKTQEGITIIDPNQFQKNKSCIRTSVNSKTNEEKKNMNQGGER